MLLFGGKKLPEMMRGLGKGVNEFKQGLSEPVTKTDSDEPMAHQQDEDTTARPTDE